MIVRIGCVCAMMGIAMVAAKAEDRIDYPSVAAAREALLAKPGARAHDESGWLVVEEPNVTWTFAPEGHEAHPSVARRDLVEEDGRLYVRTEIRCEAAKEACDRLNQAFQDLNERMMQSLEDAARGAE